MSDFLHMGGYAFFVWGSYAGMALVFAWNWYATRALRSGYERRMKNNDAGEGAE